MNVDDTLGQLTEEELRAVDAAVALLQADCSYCVKDVTTLLQTIAVDLLHAGQVLSHCRGLPEDNSTKARHVELMTRKREALLTWEGLFHERSRSICRLCQEATRRCVSVWQHAKKL